VAGQRGALLRHKRAHVDNGRDQLVGHTDLVDVWAGVGAARSTAGSRDTLSAQSGHEFARPAQRKPDEVQLGQPRRMRVPKSRSGHLVGLEVVGMPVTAGLVVGHDHLWLLLVEDVRQALDHFIERRGKQRAGPMIVRPAGHARVEVAEIDHAAHTEHARGRVQFAQAQTAHPFIAQQVAVGHGTKITSRARDDDGAYAFGAVARQDAPGGDRFVVRMGVHDEQGAAHGDPLILRTGLYSAAIRHARATVYTVSAYEVLVETTRGGIVESRHHGALVAVDAHGGVRWSIGDARLVSFPRSSLKPFQVLALVTRGGVERFGLEARDLAIACASHSGEEIHTRAVCQLLDKIDAPPEALACGTHPPIDQASAERLEQRGEQPSAVHNNCSGKHAGMLALARLVGAPLEGYLGPEHPAQQAIRATLIDVLALDPNHLPVGIDGCSAPAYAVPLDKLARGFALLGDGAQAAPAWCSALGTIGDAMGAYPELVGGTSDRVDTDLMRVTNGALVAKGGAEGYFGMGNRAGLGVAFKIIDGDAAHRGRSAVAVAAAQQLGWLDAGMLADYGPQVTISNWAGRATGAVRITQSLGGAPGHGPAHGSTSSP
jgi:L-asparaginase II